MRPAPFEYFAPRTVEEALDLLARHGEDAKLLAGGQSLVPMMNMRLVRPAVIVDLNRVAALGASGRRRAACGWARSCASTRSSATGASPPPRPSSPRRRRYRPPADPGARHHRGQPGPRRSRRRAARLHDRARRRLPPAERAGAANVPRAELLPRPPGHRARARTSCSRRSRCPAPAWPRTVTASPRSRAGTETSRSSARARCSRSTRRASAAMRAS